MKMWIVICSLVMISCSGNKQEQASSEPIVEQQVIRYERTPCFGVCPHFNFKAFNTGLCYYEGIRFVENEGNFKATCDPSEIEAIIETGLKIGFFEMDDRYDNKMVTDLPSITVELVNGDNTKAVYNRYKGPEELNELYVQLDALLEKLDWQSIE